MDAAARLRRTRNARQGAGGGCRAESISYTITIEEVEELDGRGNPRVRVRAQRDDLPNLLGPTRWLVAVDGALTSLGAGLEDIARLIVAEERRHAQGASSPPADRELD